MANPIDCSRMSHAACALEPPPEEREAAEPAESEGGVTYECVNDCVSSLGISTLINSSVAALGCAVVPEACPVLVVAAAGVAVGACVSACGELEAPPVKGE